ncbi:MAG: hypothetical protein EBX95_09540 [Acidimicrobiia bacterium]|nr:hypothetical protein [Acidimicrobiia bacterium]
MATSAQLEQIVKAYDIRGTVPDQLDADVAYALGVGFAKFTSASVAIVGRDMRPSGPELVEAFARSLPAVVAAIAEGQFQVAKNALTEARRIFKPTQETLVGRSFILLEGKIAEGDRKK